MGEIYAARQLALDRLVAVKFLALEPDVEPHVGLDRFRREAELMARVSHPNILSVYDFGSVDGRPYLVMEYVEGGDLRRRMTPGKPTPVGRVRAILGPVCEALACLHRQGILHRDLKPENILMQDETNPKVADFGIAVLRAGIGSLTRTGHGLGTLGYVAPEQQYRLKVDERADQFSLAAVAYELLTGEKALGIFKPPSHHNARLDPRVDAVIMRALQEDPAARYPSIREFGTALDEALAGVNPRPRQPFAWPLAALAILGTAVAAVLIGSPERFSGLPRTRHPREAERDPATPAVVSPTPKATPSPAPDPPRPERDMLDEAQHKLVELRAFLSWIEQGKPKGPEGEAVAKTNWFKAEREMKEQVERTAYQLWESSGRPTGEAGRLAAKANRLAAQRILRDQLNQAIGLAEQRAARTGSRSSPSEAVDEPSPPPSRPSAEPGGAGDGRPPRE
jgi:serine/threonine protein kinase